MNIGSGSASVEKSGNVHLSSGLRECNLDAYDDYINCAVLWTYFDVNGSSNQAGSLSLVSGHSDSAGSGGKIHLSTGYGSSGAL